MRAFRTPVRAASRVATRSALPKNNLRFNNASGLRYNSTKHSPKGSFDATVVLFPLTVVGGLLLCFNDKIKFSTFTHSQLNKFSKDAITEAGKASPEAVKTAEDAKPSKASSESSESSSKDSSESEGSSDKNSAPEGQEAAYNPETGEINWDCPCLGGMAHGPCGEEFKAAFSCFVYSEAEPKGVDCIEKFKDMQNCFRKYPEVYAEELRDEDVPIGDNQEAQKGESVIEEKAVEAEIIESPVEKSEISKKMVDETAETISGNGPETSEQETPQTVEQTETSPKETTEVTELTEKKNG